MSANQPGSKVQALASSSALEPKARGANRSTKVAGKLKVLPEHAEPILQQDKEANPPPPPRDRDEAGEGSGTLADSEDDDEEVEETEDVEVYNQIDLIPAGTARRDALRLTKKKAKSLPRVTAYATASSYRFSELMKFFNARRNSYHTNPRIIVDVIYTPYVYELPSAHDSSDAHSHVRSQTEGQGRSQSQTGDLLGVPELAPGASDVDGPASSNTEVQEPANGRTKKRSKFAEAPTQAEIFIFEYGTVVIWGMTEAQEKRFLSSLKRFEVERLSPQDVEMEDLNFYYASYRFTTTLSPSGRGPVTCQFAKRLHSTRRALTLTSPPLRTKLSLSHALAQSVKISLEVFWTYPDLQPLYDAARSYLEIPQRIDLLNARVEVLQDMLQLLKETVTSRHAERLEQIVIALIAVEIVLGIITILVDLFS
ncbi:hypothetical protein BN946_scf184921.g11 [Trametes cinnabarina]|uniref:DUF155 domain-containing protein n=1 Tax=Pycnoporus cinnabarinus TaxID=5643 RepID=A0A060SMW9_PYCCI|nr:hypothetical protein BN946_scf184921.g11 [Trametes cinnabarina]